MSQSKTLRLCLASPLFFPTYGGSQLRFMGYLPGFHKRGLDVSVFTGTPPVNEVTPDDRVQVWQTFASGQKLPIEHIGDIPLQRIRLPDTKGWRRTSVFNKSLFAYCEDPATRPDVLQLVGTLRHQSLPLLRKLRKLGIPVLYAVTVAPKKKIGYRIFNLKQLSEARLYNNLDGIVTNNRPLLEFVKQAGIRTRVDIIPNGVNLKRFKPAATLQDKMAIRRQFGISQDDILVTVVGAVTPRKGIDILLEAWAELVPKYTNLHILVVGPRKDKEHPALGGFRQKLEKIIKASGFSQHVHFTGLREDVENYLRASDIFVLPSSREGMPNSVLEAMACCLPVIITPFIGLSEDLGQAGKHYILADRTAAAVAAAVSMLIEDMKLRNSIAYSGHEWVIETLDIEKSLDRYTELYRFYAR